MSDLQRAAFATAFQNLFGPASAELGQMLADRVRLYRWRQAIKIIERAKEIQGEEGFRGSDASLKFFLPFIEEASKEDSDDLTDWWARLLASATESCVGFDIACIDILKSVGSHDAQVLLEVAGLSPVDHWDVTETMLELAKLLPDKEYETSGSFKIKQPVFDVAVAVKFLYGEKRLFVSAINYKQLPEWYAPHDFSMQRSLAALERLRLVEERSFNPGDFISGVDEYRWEVCYIAPTRLGAQFLGRVHGSVEAGSA